MIKLYNADSCDLLFTKIEKESIDLTVTSPPYDNLRTYNDSSSWNWSGFKTIADGLLRVTKPGGVIVWVVGDATINGSETGSSFKQALYFKEIGFNLHDTMIYQTNKPPQTHNRYEQCWEYMFIFSKGKPKTFIPILISSRNAGKNRTATMRQDSDNLTNRSKKSLVKKVKYKDNIWYLSRAGRSSGDVYSIKHPATYPDQLAQDHIISWSNENDTVLDPFMGSGTTGKMAVQNKRNFIGIEIDKEYFKLSEKRIEQARRKIKRSIFNLK